MICLFCTGLGGFRALFIIGRAAAKFLIVAELLITDSEMNFCDDTDADTTDTTANIAGLKPFCVIQINVIIFVRIQHIFRFCSYP